MVTEYRPAPSQPIPESHEAQAKLSDAQEIEAWVDASYPGWEGLPLRYVAREINERVVPEMQGFVLLYAIRIGAILV